MNSFRTREASLTALARHPGLAADVPPDFVQHREPRLRADDLRPVRWPADTELEWCPRLLGWFAAERAPFAMEVVIGTEADRKGGHIARRRDGGRLVLRETAQAPPGEAASFRDYTRCRYYNSNNLWIHLPSLAALLDANEGTIPLPLIVNRERVDLGDDASPEVVQLETAMGAAIGAFDGARAIRVLRARFAPVKTTDDLLVLRSDLYRLAADGRVERHPARDGADPFVELDRRFYAIWPTSPPASRAGRAVAGRLRAVRRARRRHLRRRSGHARDGRDRRE